MSSPPPARPGLTGGRPPSADPNQQPGWGPPLRPSTSRRGRWGIVLAAVVAVLLAAIATAVVATRAGDQGTEDSALFQSGGCVRFTAVQGRFQPADCGAPAAAGQVIAVIAGVAAEPACPDQTDLAGTSQLAQTICVRNLREPHAGDPGQGGGCSELATV